MHAIHSAQTLPGRRAYRSQGDGAERWRTDFIGPEHGGRTLIDPQAFLIEMKADDRVLPHFHEVDQFQVFVAGSGRVGRSEPSTSQVVVHYADRYTGYGPLDSGPRGWSYFTLRARTDPGPTYLHQPDYRARLKPSGKRHATVPVDLSTSAVLEHSADVMLETVIAPHEDGLAAWVLRAGPDLKIAASDSRDTGGQYWLVLAGSLVHAGVAYPPWSVLFVGADEAPADLTAGPKGCEALLAQFGR
jgi:hypothetical protein